MTTQTFSMQGGDSKTIEVTLVDAAGVPVDVTGATITYRIAAAPHNTALVTKTTGGNGVTIAASVVTIVLAPDDTADLNGVYHHELEVVDANDNVATAFRGYVIVEGDLA